MAYDNYYGKHCARFYGWLPASKAQKERVKKRSVRYFTLCAEEAIDIFMLEREGILTRDANNELPNVFICEKENNVASKIFSLVRPPLKEAIFVGALDMILTFQEDAQTRGRDLEDDDKNFNIRQKLQIRRLFHRLKRSFPFDIINFDPYGNLLDNNRDSNKRLYASLKKILELQAPIDSFLMFVTIPMTDIHVDYLTKFKKDLAANVAAHPDLAEALNAKYGTVNYDSIEEINRVAIGVSKSIINPIAKEYNWQCEHQGIYVYQNDKMRHMLSSVILFKKTTKFSADLYVQDILAVISEMPDYYPYANPFPYRDVVKDVNSIIEYRESMRNSFNS